MSIRPKSKTPIGSVSEQFEQMRGDYDSAKSSRFRRRRVVPASGSNSDYHYRNINDYLKIMEYARDMDRNDCVLGSIIDRATINTIQDGATLDFDTGDHVLDEELLGGWNEWAYDPSNCDISGEDTFADMEGKAFRSSKVDGDIWGIGTDDDYLQWMEGHRCRSPSRTAKPIFQGVELGNGRRPLAAWFTNEDLGFGVGQMLVRDFTRYDVRDRDGVRRVFQVQTSTKKRFGQTRGISALSPIFDLIGMHDDIEFAAVLKQQIQNALIFFKERDKDFKGGPEEAFGETETISRDDGSIETIEGIGVGTMLKGKPGEKLSGFSPTVPGAEFFPHVKLILTLLGINFGMPLVLVLMDASESNFSGWRGAFEQAKLGFRQNQRQMIRRFNDPVLAWHLASRAKRSSSLERSLEKIRRNAKTSRAPWYCWHLPSWPYVQPVDDRTADLLAVANYQESPSTNMAKNGIDHDREIRRCISDRGKAIEWAMAEAERLNQIRKNLGITNQPEVKWDQLYTPPQPKFVTMTVSESRDVAKKDAGGKSNVTVS